MRILRRKEISIDLDNANILIDTNDTNNTNLQFELISMIRIIGMPFVYWYLRI